MEETKELKEELKVKSFRITEEMHDKFKEVANEIGGNQQQTLSKLIEAYNFQKGKAILTEKKSDIEQFENYVSCLTTMYMRSLEDNQNINATVQIQFEDLLKSKDETIKDLQAKLKETKEIKEGATRKAKTMEEEVERLNQFNIEQEKTFNAKLDGLQDTLKEKDSLNLVLKDSCNRFKEQVEQMKAEIEKANGQQEELENLQKEHNKLQSDFNALEAKLNNVEEEHKQTIEQMQKHENEEIERVKEQCQFAQDKAILELENKHLQEMKELQDEYMQKMKEYFDNLSLNSVSDKKKRKNTRQGQNNSKATDAEVAEPTEQ